MLHKYALKYLFYAEGDKKDLELLKETCETLTYTSNPSLFLEVLKLYMQMDDKSLLKTCVKGCLRFMNSPIELKGIYLTYVFSPEPDIRLERQTP